MIREHLKLNRRGRGLNHARGVTLMELMMVIAIVGVLSGMAFMSISNTQNKGKANEETAVVRRMLKKARNLALGNLTCTRVYANANTNELRFIEFDSDPTTKACPSLSSVTFSTVCSAMPVNVLKCEERQLRAFFEILDFRNSTLSASSSSNVITFGPNGGLIQTGMPHVRVLRTALSETGHAQKKAVNFIIYPAIGNVRMQND